MFEINPPIVIGRSAVKIRRERLAIWLWFGGIPLLLFGFCVVAAAAIALIGHHPLGDNPIWDKYRGDAGMLAATCIFLGISYELGIGHQPRGRWIFNGPRIEYADPGGAVTGFTWNDVRGIRIRPLRIYGPHGSTIRLPLFVDGESDLATSRALRTLERQVYLEFQIGRDILQLFPRRPDLISWLRVTINWLILIGLCAATFAATLWIFISTHSDRNAALNDVGLFTLLMIAAAMVMILLRSVQWHPAPAWIRREQAQSRPL